MNDTPGWASPGSAASDGQEPGATGPAEPAARPGPAEQPGAGPQDSDSKWSKEQPPPGQWSAPTGPPAPGQAPPPPPPGSGWGGRHPGGHGGPGGYGGVPGGYQPWGGGWGGPPTAAKPGVIPLRPLGVGEILDGAVSTMRTYWRTVLGISLAVAVVTQVIIVLLQGLVLDDRESTDVLSDPSASVSEVTHAMGQTLAGTGAVLLVSLVGTVIATALLTTVTSRAVLGRPVTTREAWHDARPQIPRLFGLILLLLAIGVGAVLCGALPGILVAVAGDGGGAAAALTALGLLGGAIIALWLVIRFSLASPTLMLEKQGVVKAMSRSAKLVRGSWWRVFGIQLLATIIANIVASIIVIPFTAIAAALSGEQVANLLNGSNGNPGWTFLVISGIGAVIGSMITFPITAGVTVLLYIDQRIRREALDLELARAAGVQGYGGANTAPGS
ncbi:glycerophosphoryl diester phosphodiesterase membrane domain-containing protein [Streptomyces sp. NPDC086787]|uniref:glycerophosphoryl diester phosphodiesterase membrane domain-containing protein n=1 Tax=Streptomyces sp. NPDC086787 TaxID=3365759 RepID=UPI00382DCDC1